jgi:hypothetical protein
VATINDPGNFVCEIVELGPITGVMEENELLNKFEAWNNGSGPPIHVQKRGITSGVTRGTIDSINYGPIGFKYDHDLGIVQFPASMIEIKPDSGDKFSAPGDSGSCIVDDSGKAIGLIVGGIGDDGSTTAANHIDLIRKRFNISICQA